MNNITLENPKKDLSEDEIRECSEKLMVALAQAANGVMGNVTLQKQLNWPDNQYWEIRNRLLNEGKLERGRGKGGSVRLITENVDQLSPELAAVKSTSIVSPES